MEEQNLLKSSKIGWPFWIPVIVTTIPFTIWFLHSCSDYKTFPWWKIGMAGIVGLMPAMVVGLIVQLLWDIVIAIAEGNFILIDFFFMLLLLAFGAGLKWFNLRENISDSDRQSEWLLALIVSPLIGLYVRKRMKRKNK